MDEPSSYFRLRQFSSGELPVGARLELWRDTITRHMIHLTIDPLTDDPFLAEASLRKHPGMTTGAGTISASVSRRNRDIVSADNDDLFLMLNVSGPLLLNGGRRELALAPGEAALLCCQELGVFVRPEVGTVSCIRLSRSALAPFVPGLEDHIFKMIPRNVGALHFLRAYLAAMNDTAGVEITEAVSRTMASHVTDLIALTLGATRDAAGQAHGGGLRAARLATAKAYVESCIGPDGLSVEDVAEHMGVSARYVRKLFEAEGWSFSRYVLQRRLLRVRGMLTNGRFDHMPISSLAYDAGFGDLSYFNKVFRAAFGGTPSDLRHAARPSGAEPSEPAGVR
ncbi:MAG TPA: helix-turn-helix transcriptional regulator [Caulobacteraceae bacterium]|jgi:AraC-like DNA-binding protein|nr:helix-turn-helix transcriptional regulator [Caulobacteraceae bacterium]